MSLTITSLTIALLLLVQVALTFYVVAQRVSGQVLIGDGNNADLIKRMRIHANFTEVVPITLIAMAVLELQGGSNAVMISVGGMLVTGRLLHPIGMQGAKYLKLRQAGMVLTLLAMLACSVALVLRLVN